jgi:hypothetical protein
MSLRPHFIKISDVLIRGIARSTVKREMLRSLRHIAETIDAVMIAEGIERLDDVVALRDLGLRYGQGYYMARPGQGFPTVPDDVRGELRNVTLTVPDVALVATDDEEDDDDRDMPRTLAIGSSRRMLADALVRNAFGRAEDEITKDFQIPQGDPSPASSGIHPMRGEPVTAWRPLTDDELGAAPEAEPLLDSLRRAQAVPDIAPDMVPDMVPDDDGGGGRPGLN